MDVLIQDGHVQAILPPGRAPTAADVLDASGLHILPGVVDAHVRFNEPGRTDWEGFLTGSTAAAAGGVTTVCDAAGHDTPLDWARSRPPSTEGDAVRRALEFARETGNDVRLHFVHISTSAAARLIGEARAAGQDVSVETCPHYLALDESDLERLGNAGKCAPPLRGRHEVEGLWQALLNGTIDWVASDHSPCPPSMKDTDTIWSAWGGIGGVQTLLPVLLTEGFFARGLSLPRLVTLTAGNPSRRLGLYPRKGALEIGSDADLVLVDLAHEWTLTETDLRTRWRGNPFLGKTFRGQVVLTMVRGTVVWRDGAARV